MEQAVLGGGCFWCIEAVFQRVRGVARVESGYAAGHVPNPTYRQICEGTTGHAEVCRVTFDPAEVSFRDLLQVFFAVHDPTTANRQGNDVGTQYRSIILSTTEEQARVARALMKELEEQQAFRNPVVTEVLPLEEFFEGEGYHQNYFNDNPGQSYCAYVVAPKVEKFLARFPDRAVESAG